MAKTLSFSDPKVVEAMHCLLNTNISVEAAKKRFGTRVVETCFLIMRKQKPKLDNALKPRKTAVDRPTV